MKKNNLTFAIIIAAEIAATIFSLTVFSQTYSLWAVCLLVVELIAAIAFFIHAEDYENQLELMLMPLFISPIISSFIKTSLHLIFLPIVFLIIFLAVEAIRRKYKKAEVPLSESEDKSELYANKSVLLIVPHQDDDINLMGGIIEEYIKYKSDIRICFYTNGDMETAAEIRLNESLRVAEFYGIPSENIIFMGYGDRWNSEFGHIYTCADDELVSSASGKTQTYALPNHPAYNNGTEYKHKNVVNDMKSIIEEIKPTDIFCVDYDCHTDHIACSLFFEEALLGVLKNNSNYQPNVFKGFAYETAFFSEKDFFRTNIASTVNERRTDYMKEFVNFNWYDRVRFPVSTKSTTRFIENSSVYRALSFYQSQNATDYAESIINGDKVFWRRRTDSVLYNAKISTSSGNANLLNDFKIFDTDALHDFPMSNIKGIYIPNSSEFPKAGIWHPDLDDEKKEIKIKLAEKKNIKFVCLYDNPSRTDNIINAEIVFDNGKVIETGPLNSDGSATLIKVSANSVSSFIVRITDWDGNEPGLTEIEAFEKENENEPCFIKLTDECENFIYDYIIESGDQTKLSLYSYNHYGLSLENYTISCSNNKCSAIFDDEMIIVNCPKGESCIITVASKDDISDSVKISNPKDKKLLKKAIGLDKYYYRILKPHSQKMYYKKMLLYFYDKLIWTIKGFKTTPHN